MPAALSRLLLILTLGGLVPAAALGQGTTTDASPEISPMEKELRRVFPLPEGRASLTQDFTTAGHPKARGIRLRMRYPAGWELRDGGGPGIVQAFFGPGTGNKACLMFSQLDLPSGQPPTWQEQKDLLKVDVRKSLLAKDDVFHSGSFDVISGRPACKLEWSTNVYGTAIDTRCLDFLFIDGTTLITLRCTVDTQRSEQAGLLPFRMDEMKPLFEHMAYSMVVQRGGPPPASTATRTPEQIQDGVNAALRIAKGGSPPGAGMKLFATQGHPKASGLNISLEYPAEWLAEEATTADTLQIFSPAGHLTSVFLAVEPVLTPAGAPLGEAAVADLLTPAALKAYLHPEMTFVSGKAPQFSGRPACRMRSTFPAQKGAGAAGPVDLMSAVYFHHQGVLMSLTCFAVGRGESEQSRQFEEMDAVVGRFAHSVVFHEGPPHAPATVTAPMPAAAPPPTTAAAPPRAPTQQELRAAFWDSRGALTQAFSTAGNPKARGIDLRLNYPAKWLAKDIGFMANLQAFIYPGSLDHVALDFVPVEGDAEDDLDQILSEYGYAEFMPPGGEFYDGNVMTLGGRPAAMVEYTHSEQVGDTTEHSRSIRYVFAHGSTQVHLTGSVSATDPARVPLLAAHMDEMRPLYQAMAESVTFHGGGAPMAPAPPPATTTTIAPPPAAASASAASPPSSSTSAATPPPAETFPWKAELILLARCLLGGLFCVGMLRTFVYVTDKRSPQGGYTGGRLAYLGLCFVQFLLTGLLLLFYIVFFRDFAESEATAAATTAADGPRVAGTGMWMGCSYLSIRRLQDIGWSPWLAACGLFVALFHMTGYWMPLAIPAGLVMLASPVLFFIPGRSRRGPPASADHQPLIPESPRSSGPARPVGPPAQPAAASTPAHAPAPARAPASPPAPPALITLLQGGETYGPYATHQLLELWDTGQVAGNASYWRKGMADYRPLVKDVEHLRTLAGTGMA